MPNLSPRTRACAAVGALFTAALVSSCSEPPAGTQLFRLAVNGAPGGSLLSVWGDVTAPPAVHPEAYLAGGYVGVDHAAIADGHVGRLVRYTTGAFATVCTTDEVLWWVHGTRADDPARPVVFAAGEGARVLRLRDGACETLAVDVTYPEGRPTFWGLYALSASDVWFVGGSALPSGPRGVLVHYDGTSFRQEPALPAAALRENLYKIDRDNTGALVVVGSGGVILRRSAATNQWAMDTSNARPNDNRLFTVSCNGASTCTAVGGTGAGLLLRYEGTTWHPAGNVEDSPGLNGVWQETPSSTYIVGTHGYTQHFNGVASFSPPTALTPATLHGVGGGGGVVIAVGGELDTNTVAQRGVILVRGDASPTFTFDGATYMAAGDLRTMRSGGGSQ